MPEEVILIMSVLSTLLPILAALGGMAYWLGRRFALIEARFRDIDRRFEEMRKSMRLTCLRKKPLE